MQQEEFLKEKKGANFFGFEIIDADGKKSSKLAVLRGNGTLKLTKNELLFSRWMPKKEFVIPLDQIEKVEIKRVHNLKTKFLPVLRVFYPEGEGTKVFGVCIGFKKETKQWKQELENAINELKKQD